MEDKMIGLDLSSGKWSDIGDIQLFLTDVNMDRQDDEQHHGRAAAAS